MRWISIALAALLAHDLWSHHPVDEVGFLQVGQGDATLISQQGTHLLVDCGPRNEGFDGGQRFVWPELRKRGIRRLDAVVITHFDRDHYGGLEAVAERIQVDRVIVIAPQGLSDQERAILAAQGIRSDQLVVLNSAQKLKVGSVFVDVVPGLTGENADDNSRSPYLAVAFGEDRVVLTGDAPSDVEETWISQGVSPGRVIKAGHHGSNQSLSEEWLKAMKPEYVVFSSGRNNPWRHPDSRPLSRVKESGATVLRTDMHGTVTFRPDDSGALRLATTEDRPPLLQLFER